jgi:outer membrane protein TolC
LAESAASLDIDSAMLNLRQARIDVASEVRSFYFAAIVAREKLKLARALSTFTEKLYEAQIELVEGGEAAPYEPLQLRVLALQARASVALSQQEYLSAWRQMAASLGLPGLPITELAGRPDVPVPRIEYERALS